MVLNVDADTQGQIHGTSTLSQVNNYNKMLREPNFSCIVGKVSKETGAASVGN